MKTFKKHHFGPWLDRNTELTTFGRLCVQEGEVHSKCTRCKVMVKMGQSGGVKFWVGGKWVSKRPACQVSEGP